MEFAKGYEDGFTGKSAQSNDPQYMRGYNLGLKQSNRVISGENTSTSAKIKPLRLVGK